MGLPADHLTAMQHQHHQLLRIVKLRALQLQALVLLLAPWVASSPANDGQVVHGRPADVPVYTASGVAAVPAAPFLDVRAFGAIPNDDADDTKALQAAIDAAENGWMDTKGIVVFPAGAYVISDTLNSSGAGNHLLGSGSGMFSGPQLVWAGRLNGTMLSVQHGHHGFRMENFYLQGNGSCGVLVHITVKAHPAGATHNPQLAHLMFNGYTRYGLILGEDNETELGDGELSDGVFQHLRFSNTVLGSTGILINAQNMEIGSFYTLRFDGGVEHKHHIFNRAGIAKIYSLVSTRAYDYAIVAWDTVSVFGWRSEDRLLFTSAAVGFSSPVVISELLQRGSTLAPGEKCADVIVWNEQGHVPFAVSDSIVEGNIVLGPTIPTSSSFINIDFKNAGQVVALSPSNASVVELQPRDGLLRFRAQSPQVVLEDLHTQSTVLAMDGGLRLTGMMQLAVGSDVPSAAQLNFTDSGSGSGNLIKITGSNTIQHIDVLQAGTMVTLYFEAAVTVAVGGNLKLAGPFAAEAHSTLMLASTGSEWLELGRSRNR